MTGAVRAERAVGSGRAAAWVVLVLLLLEVAPAALPVAGLLLAIFVAAGR